MGTTYLNFTTNGRKYRDDALNHPGKAGASNIAKLTDAEWNHARNMIAEAFGMLGASNIDATQTCSMSLTSGSIVVFQLTV